MAIARQITNIRNAFLNRTTPKASMGCHGVSWGVKTTCFKAPGVSLGGFGVSIGGVRSLRDLQFYLKSS